VATGHRASKSAIQLPQVRLSTHAVCLRASHAEGAADPRPRSHALTASRLPRRHIHQLSLHLQEDCFLRPHLDFKIPRLSSRGSFVRRTRFTPGICLSQASETVASRLPVPSAHFGKNACRNADQASQPQLKRPHALVGLAFGLPRQRAWVRLQHAVRCLNALLALTQMKYL
jgi:hypothetical protein